jgi:hypothetical protein
MSKQMHNHHLTQHSTAPTHSLQTPLGHISNRNQPQPMSNILIVQHATILGILHQIDGKRGNLGDHDAPESIGHGGVGFGEDELDVVWGYVEDFYFGEALLGHFVGLLMRKEVESCHVL